MKFDTIIIGGGLSGLMTGIKLAKAHKRTAIISAGQSTLHFNSGSFDLLGYDDNGKEIENPLEAISKLGEGHPYSKIGTKNIESLATEAREILFEAGIDVEGDATRNHYRLTPMGHTKPTWLTLHDFATLQETDKLPWKKVTIVNIKSYLDFPVSFFANGMKELGIECTIKSLSIEELEEARRSPSEMRATNIAKVLSNTFLINKVATEIKLLAEDAEVVLLPAVLGISNNEFTEELKKQINIPIQFVATLPPSVTGGRIQNQLSKYFKSLGGVILTGDVAKNGKIEDSSACSVETNNLTDTILQANHFVLASGSFMSSGLVSNYEKIYEPIFNLDVDADDNRNDWCKEFVFDDQPYMRFGVSTDQAFHAIKDGKAVNNLYAVGSILSGHNQLKQADGTGVSMLTALQVAKNILN